VIGLEGDDVVVAPAQPVPGAELDDLNRKLDLLDPHLERTQEDPLRSFRTVQHQPFTPLLPAEDVEIRVRVRPVRPRRWSLW
jgi:hypothetical protein